MPKKRRRGCRGKGKRIGRKAKTSKVPSKPDVDESIPSSSEDRQNQPKSHAVYMRNWRNSQTGKESTSKTNRKYRDSDKGHKTTKRAHEKHMKSDKWA